MSSSEDNDKSPTGSNNGRQISANDARELLPSLFLGSWNKMDDSKGSLQGQASTDSRSTAITIMAGQKQQHDQVAKSSDEAAHKEAPPRHTTAVEKAAEQLASWIKKDARELRDSWIFKEAYKQIQWQRDSYIVGTEYANWSRRRRQREDGAVDARSVQAYLTLMPYDDSVGSQQLAKIAADFIPTNTVKNSLLPIVLQLPQSALYRPTQTALVDIIRAQKVVLDGVVKSSLLAFLDSPANRESIKNRTKGYISRYEYEHDRDKE